MYYDEEECLGFDVFVAELELIVGTRKDKRPDEVQLLELLQKLLVSVSKTDKAVLKQYQKRCEAVLVDLLYKGTCKTVSAAGQLGTLPPATPQLYPCRRCNDVNPTVIVNFSSQSGPAILRTQASTHMIFPHSTSMHARADQEPDQRLLGEDLCYSRDVADVLSHQRAAGLSCIEGWQRQALQRCAPSCLM